jgi:hypothetical protein
MPARTTVVTIKPPRIETVFIDVEGETELIMHRWSDKAKRMMLDKQMGKAVERKPKKDPEEDYQASIYHLDDGQTGFPAGAFKAAIVGACRLFDGLPMTQAKIAIRVDGEENAAGEQLVRIEGEPRMREDMVRLETGVADIRYRAGFPKWRARLKITYNASMLSPEQLYNLVNAAGFGGVGEWRPSAPRSSSGSYGCFRVTGSPTTPE